MKVNGIQLKSAIKLWEIRRDALTKRFDTTFFARKEEVKDHPTKVMDELINCESMIAVLQSAQAKYNQATTITLNHNGSVKMSLCEGIKRVGGANRVVKLWSNQIGQPEDKYEHYRLSPSSEREVSYPERKMSIADTVTKAAEATSYATALTGAIAMGNTRVMELPTVTEEMLK